MPKPRHYKKFVCIIKDASFYWYIPGTVPASVWQTDVPAQRIQNLMQRIIWEKIRKLKWPREQRHGSEQMPQKSNFHKNNVKNTTYKVGNRSRQLWFHQVKYIIPGSRIKLHFHLTLAMILSNQIYKPRLSNWASFPFNIHASHKWTTMRNHSARLRQKNSWTIRFSNNNHNHSKTGIYKWRTILTLSAILLSTLMGWTSAASSKALLKFKFFSFSTSSCTWPLWKENNDIMASDINLKVTKATVLQGHMHFSAVQMDHSWN